MQRSMGLDLLVLSLRRPHLLKRTLDNLTRGRLNAAAFADVLNPGFLCRFAAQGIQPRT